MKKRCKIFSVILAISMVLSMFCFGTVSAETEPNADSNILLNNDNITITPLQIATEGLDWTKTSFSYEGMEVRKGWLKLKIKGNEYSDQITLHMYSYTWNNNGFSERRGYLYCESRS